MSLNPTVVFEHQHETIERVDDMPCIDKPGFRQLLDHWCVLRDRAEGAMPKRADLDPVAFPKALSTMWIYQRMRNQDGDPRYICRLSGEEVRLRYKKTITGQYLDTFISPLILPLVEEHYRMLLEDSGIGWSFGKIYLKSLGRQGFGQRILLPMTDDDGVSNFIVGASEYEPLELLDDLKSRPKAPSRIIRYIIPFEVYDRARQG